MNWYWILYLASIADGVKILSLILGGLGGVFFIMTTINRFAGEINDEEYHKLKPIRLLTFILLPLGILTPQTKQIYLITGIGTVMEYVVNSEEVKKLPDNAIKALNYYLEDITKEEKQNTQQNE